MDIIDELISFIGAEYILDKVEYVNDLEKYGSMDYPHTNSILLINKDLD
jgi:hypothetical protein